MAMIIPTAEIRRTGNNLEEIAGKMRNLAARANSINEAITGCYMQGGVGRRAGDAASTISRIASSTKNKGSNLCIAAKIYGNTENKLCSQGKNVVSTIQNGYNVTWAAEPKIACIAGAVVQKATALTAEKSTFQKYLSNDLEKSGSYYQNGVVSALNYKLKVENLVEWDVKKGNIGAGVEASAGGSLLKISDEGSVGIASGKYEVSVGAAKGKAKAKLNFISNGKIKPSAELELKAEAHAIEGKVEGSLGNDDFDVHAKGEGAVGVAKAEAKFALGKGGIGGKAEVGVAAASGKATCGFKVFGIKVDASIKGEAGALGAEAEFGVTNKSVEVGGKLSFLAGLGLKIKISW